METVRDLHTGSDESLNTAIEAAQQNLKSFVQKQKGKLRQ